MAGIKKCFNSATRFVLNYFASNFAQSSKVWVKSMVVFSSIAGILFTFGYWLHEMDNHNHYLDIYFLITRGFQELASEVTVKCDEVTAYFEAREWVEKNNLTFLERPYPSHPGLEIFKEFSEWLGKVPKNTTDGSMFVIGKWSIVKSLDRDIATLEAMIDNVNSSVLQSRTSSTVHSMIEVVAKTCLIYGLVRSSKTTLILCIIWPGMKMAIMTFIVPKDYWSGYWIKMWVSDMGQKLFPDYLEMSVVSGFAFDLTMMDNGAVFNFFQEVAHMSKGERVIIYYVLQYVWLLFHLTFFVKSAEAKIGRPRKMVKPMEQETEAVKGQRLADLCLRGKPADLKDYIRKYDYKIDINDVHDNDGQPTTALHLVIQRRNLELVKLMIATMGRKIDFSRTNCKGQTALDFAIIIGSPDAVKVLLRYKRFPKVAEKNLIAALKTDDPEIMQAIYSASKSKGQPLLDSKADLAFRVCLDCRREKNNGDYADAKALLIRLLDSKKSNAAADVTLHDQKCWDSFICTACLKLAKPPLKIFACSTGHYVCSKCLDIMTASKSRRECKVCNEDFAVHKPRRRATAERLLEALLGDN